MLLLFRPWSSTGSRKARPSSTSASCRVGPTATRSRSWRHRKVCAQDYGKACSPTGRCHGVRSQHIVSVRKKDTGPDDRPLTQKPFPWPENLSKLASRRLDRNGTFLSLGQRLTDSPAPCPTLRPSRYRNPAHKPSDDATRRGERNRLTQRHRRRHERTLRRGRRRPWPLHRGDVVPHGEPEGIGDGRGSVGRCSIGTAGGAGSAAVPGGSNAITLARSTRAAPRGTSRTCKPCAAGAISRRRRWRTGASRPRPRWHGGRSFGSL